MTDAAASTTTNKVRAARESVAPPADESAPLIAAIRF
jgi:hypothetical protein